MDLGAQLVPSNVLRARPWELRKGKLRAPSSTEDTMFRQTQTETKILISSNFF